jgi:cytosine deaminase
MGDVLIRRAHIRDGEPSRDILVEDGVITRIESQINVPERTTLKTLDANDRVVLPGLIESHIHPDKALLEDKKPNISGTLAEAIRNTGEVKAQFSVDDVVDRAGTVMRWASSKGTTIMRAHPDVDPIAKLIGVQGMLQLKEAFRDIMDVEVVAFPQEGIIKAPGAYELLTEAMQMGCAVVGGCPYNEATMEDTIRHIELVFELAERFGAPVDMHVDFTDNTSDPRYMTAEIIAEMTEASGMQGRVTLGHVTTLGSVEPDHPVFDKLAKAGVSIVTLPPTDLYLNGRADSHNIRRGVAPVQTLLQHGVNVVYSSNNVRNAFTPLGNADLILGGYLLAEVNHIGSAQFATVLDMVTTHAALALGRSHEYGIKVGAVGDFVIVDSHRVGDVIADQPAGRTVIKRGLVVSDTKVSTESRAIKV